MTPQDGDRDADLCGLLAREVVSLVLSLEEAAWGPVEEKIIAHTRAAVERETAQLRAELATWKDSFSNAIEQAHNDVNKEKEAHAETLRMERQAHERIEKLEGTVAQLRARFVEQAVFALYESGRDSKGDPVVSVTWDGCCSESRDKDALRLILQKAFDIEHSFDPLRSVTALRAKLTAA